MEKKHLCAKWDTDFAYDNMLDKVQRMILDPIEREKEYFLSSVEGRIKTALKCYIPQPINGEPTKNKMRWRGIYVVYPSDMINVDVNNPLLITGMENPKMMCSFTYPVLIGKPSRSGKRKAFLIDLGDSGFYNAEYIKEDMYKHATEVESILGLINKK